MAEGLKNVSWRPPTLAGRRVLLRGWEVSDAEAVLAYASDPQVARYMAWEQHHSIADPSSTRKGWRLLRNLVVAPQHRLARIDASTPAAGSKC